jgi:phosphatidylethanolamine-binding protein (PEBP) family uncharacterized protein
VAKSQSSARASNSSLSNNRLEIAENSSRDQLFANAGKMKAVKRGALAVVSVGLLMASGCGSSSRSSGAQSTGASGASAALAGLASRAHAVGPGQSAQSNDVATLGVESAARSSDGVIAPRYTCKGAEVSLPVSWVGVTNQAKEIVVLVRTLLGPGRFAVNWAVAGISPSLSGIAAGKLPPGAVVGRNSFGRVGYSLCPVKGASLPLVTIAVNALPRKIALRRGFDPALVAGLATHPGVQWGSVLAYTRPIARSAGG